MANNIINAVFGSGICAVTTSTYRANYGMVLRFSGIDLPAAFECDFSNYDTSNNDSITAIGQNGEVQIPDDLWDSGLNIYAYVYLHPTDDSGVTVYTVTIPVLGRPNRTEEQPTPHEQSVIEQAISALNDAVEQTAADVVAADASASAAAQSEANAATSERSAAASAGAALASQNAAESASQSATESASGASESARNAANSASAAAESASDAQESAEQAERSVQSIGDDVERAERAAATATEKATAASGSATAASTKATEASASATAAAQSASSAASSAQNAASSEQSAQSSATDAEQAKTDAQDAQAAAEQAAESVSGLSEQIAQNTSDIADLVQSKAGALIDTATGSIASFVPDSTVPTVKGLTVDIEPVQDLHGYDHPWPAGGGKNKANVADYSQSIENAYFADKAIGVQLTAGVTYTFSCDITSTFDTFNLSAGAGGNRAYRVDILIKTKQQNGRVFITFTPTAEQLATYTELYVRVPRFSTPQTGTFSVSNIQLELGSTATSWTPYSNICPISGWDAIEVQRTGVNVLNPSADAFVQTWSYLWQKDVVPNGAVANMSFTDKDTSVDATGCYFGFVADDLSTTSISPNDFRWVLLNGAIASNKSNVSSQGRKLCRGVFIYPKTVATLNKIFARWDVQVELGTTATAYKPYQGDTYQIQLGQTVYGGTVDAVNGVLTVDRAMVDLGSLNWVYYSNVTRFAVRLDDGKYSGTGFSIADECFCSCYPALANQRYASQPDKSVTVGSSFFSTTTCALVVHDSNYTDANTFKTAVTGQQLVYELATPITISLTPIEVAVITGQTNNIWADSGDVSVEYAADLKTYIDNKIAAAVAALS